MLMERAAVAAACEEAAPKGECTPMSRINLRQTTSVGHGRQASVAAPKPLCQLARTASTWIASFTVILKP